jgi:hypothetical protein
MEFLKGLGIAGFFFFLIKGLFWIVLFVLIYFGLVDKEKLRAVKARFRFWKRK